MRTKSLAYKLGKRIRLLRKAAGMTQAQLAEAANISVNFVGYIERAQRAPSIGTLERIAKALNVAPKELFEFSNDEESELAYSSLLAELRKCGPEDLCALVQIAKRLVDKEAET